MAPPHAGNRYRCSLPGLAGFTGQRWQDHKVEVGRASRGNLEAEYHTAPHSALENEMQGPLWQEYIGGSHSCGPCRASCLASYLPCQLPGELPGGEEGIRTPGTFRHTRFPIVHLRPLGHLSRARGVYPLSGFVRPKHSRPPDGSPAGLCMEPKVVQRPTKPDLAESKGFEPLVPLPAHLISNQAPSTARTALRGGT